MNLTISKGRSSTTASCRPAARGGIVKTATISFGQAMPLAPMERAERETLAADLFIVIGSAGLQPAASFPLVAEEMAPSWSFKARPTPSMTPPIWFCTLKSAQP